MFIPLHSELFLSVVQTAAWRSTLHVLPEEHISWATTGHRNAIETACSAKKQMIVLKSDIFKKSCALETSVLACNVCSYSQWDDMRNQFSVLCVAYLSTRWWEIPPNDVTTTRLLRRLRLQVSESSMRRPGRRYGWNNVHLPFEPNFFFHIYLEQIVNFVKFRFCFFYTRKRNLMRTGIHRWQLVSIIEFYGLLLQFYGTTSA